MFVQQYIKNAYQDDPSPEHIERRLHQFTGLTYIEIFESMNQRRTSFDPEIWDAIVRARWLLVPQYRPDSNLFWNMTREEMDDEADRHFREQLEQEEDNDHGGHEAAIWGVRVPYMFAYYICQLGSRSALDEVQTYS